MSKPFTNEPDTEDIDGGDLYPRHIRRGPGMHLCGYVSLPPGHPWHGKDYDDIPVSVHGGLTYAEPADESVARDAAPRGWWVIGFDCAHGGDLVPLYGVGGTYRDIAYVRGECASLAKQAKAATDPCVGIGDTPIG